MPRFITIRDPRHAESIVREAFNLGERRLNQADIAKGMEALARRNPSLRDPQGVRPGSVISVPDEAVFEPQRPVERPGGGGRGAGGRSTSTGGRTRPGPEREPLRVEGHAAARLVDPSLLGSSPKARRLEAIGSGAAELSQQLKAGLERAGGDLAEEAKLVAALRKAQPDDAVVRRELDEIEQGIQGRIELAKDRVKRSAKAIDGLLGRLDELRRRFGD